MNNFKKIPLLLSIIFFVFLSFAIFFLYGKINSNNEKAELAISELENETNTSSQIKLLNNSIETIKEDKVKLETHFARSSDIVPFLDTIEGLGPKAGVKAETTGVFILEDNSGLVVKINASGSFSGIYKFLRLLENSPYELEFVGFDIQKQAGSNVVSGETLVKNFTWDGTFNIKLLSFVP